MRDLVDCCPDAESDCGEDKPKAEARGCEVFVGNNLIRRFDPQSDAGACTNALEYANRWNERNGRPCPDCGALPGANHNPGCDVEQCGNCGGQRLGCSCGIDLAVQRLPWTGEWPGTMECREFGWYSKRAAGRGWQRCDETDPQAGEDLNRLAVDAVWDKEQGRFILPPEAV